ncbi:hypothetical protein [Janthinobacterium sp. LB3P118]|uniref:hypothetical protein n=1 Tax=Janthinobacterium sp. LB3P118 TaxID=3424195 RepID=UPI003F232921
MHIASIARLGALATALLGAAIACGSASAHQIWLQQDGKAASAFILKGSYVLEVQHTDKTALPPSKDHD